MSRCEPSASERLFEDCLYPKSKWSTSWNDNFHMEYTVIVDIEDFVCFEMGLG